MHPDYAKRRRRAKIIGGTLIVLGVIGSLLPFLQGLVLILVGLTVLSPFVGFVQGLRTCFALAFPTTAARVVKYETKLFNWLRLLPYTRAYTKVMNRKGIELSVIVEPSEIHEGTALLLHSASGTKDTHVMDTLAARCQERGFSVVRFDAAEGIGASAGTYAEFTMSNYLTDLEDMVAWVKTQDWYAAPLVLVGHSIGGSVAAYYAADHREEVSELLLIAPTVSSARYLAAFEQLDPVALKGWQDTGTRTVRNPFSGNMESMSYAFVDDLMHYDLTLIAPRLTMPVTVFHGDSDRTTLRGDVEALVTAVGETAKLRTIPGLRHTPRRPDEYHELRKALKEWGGDRPEEDGRTGDKLP